MKSIAVWRGGWMAVSILYAGLVTAATTGCHARQTGDGLGVPATGRNESSVNLRSGRN
jgi:hypothetical protein